MRIAVKHISDTGSQILWDSVGAGLAVQLAVMEAEAQAGETPEIPEGLVYLVDHIDEWIESMSLLSGLNQ